MEIFEIFRTSANHEQSVKMKAYMRDQFDYLGMQSFIMRAETESND